MTTNLRKPIALTLTLGLTFFGLVGCSSGESSTEDFCKVANQYSDDNNPLDDLDPEEEDALANVFLGLAKDFKSVNPPAEIKEDWNTVIEMFETFGNGAKGIDLENEEDQAKITELLESFAAEEFETASENIGDFVDENCTATSK